MKILLVAINAKYSHMNLAVRSLSAYASVHSRAVRDGLVFLSSGEWNVNQPQGAVLRGIFSANPDVILFSTYIWNRDAVIRCARDIRKVLPSAVIGLGGPEVSWDPGRAFRECPDADLVLSGEGEATFAELCDRIADNRFSFEASRESLFMDIPGLCVRRVDGTAEAPYVCGGERPPLSSLDEIPFPYGPEQPSFEPEHRIAYYESSRGCPFRCAYCLSSRDGGVRYRSVGLVLDEIAWFLDAGFPLVKFVDRTFNLDPSRYLRIWEFIRARHNGKTRFHFEISAEYLTDEAFALLETMPPGSVQFEIGIQSANPDTLAAVSRPARLDALAERINRIPHSIPLHLDLIAGLPGEDLASFARSFDYAFAFGADALQLGFLKILPGTAMERIARDSAGYRWSENPPYEVLSSPVLSYADLLVLKEVETLVDAWHNAGLMRHTLRHLAPRNAGAFSLFRALASHAARFFPDGDLFLPRRPADAFACMASWLSEREDATALEWLRYDFLLQGKPGAIPPWCIRRYSKEAHDAALAAGGMLERPGEHPMSRREGYSVSEYERFDFNRDGRELAYLFRYGNGGRFGVKGMAEAIRL